ncbi:MAG: hypothetical protein ACRCZP_19960 [Phycicoccus sp.]
MIEGQATRTWKFYEGEQPVRSDSRWFKFEWDGEGDTEDGFMGPLSVDTTVTCSIVVDYGGIPERRVKIVAADDWGQLNDVLNRLKDSNTGLRWVKKLGWDFANQDRNQARIVLQYTVRYMKARG